MDSKMSYGFGVVLDVVVDDVVVLCVDVGIELVLCVVVGAGFVFGADEDDPLVGCSLEDTGVGPNVVGVTLVVGVTVVAAVVSAVIISNN